MKTFTIQIECENSAFEDNAQWEITKILERLIKSDEFDLGMGDFSVQGRLHDTNGNIVGKWKYGS